jgi:hypothetical protein
VGQSVFYPDSSQHDTEVADFSPASIGVNKCPLAGEGRSMASGVIQRYFDDIKMGTIQGTDMGSYSFKRADWISSSEPKAGIKVTFELEQNRPVKIRVKE